MNTVVVVAGAALNSLWQAVALAFLVQVGMKLAGPRLNAATRHLVWWMALAAMVTLPAIPRRAPRPAIGPAPTPRMAREAAFPLAVARMRELQPAAAPVTVEHRSTSLWPYMLAAMWVLVLVRHSLSVARSYFHLRGVKQRSTVWNRGLPKLRRAARLLLSEEISSPIAVGFLDPVVILPEGLREQLTEAEMECVLLHESAHLARFDDWANFAAQALEAVLALHPVAWWMLRQIEREREMACDDWVVAHTGAAHAYAESLARVVELRLQPADALLAAGIFTRQSRLRERIEMLLRRGRGFSPVAARTPFVSSAAALVLLAIAGAFTPHWIAFAQRLEFEVASVKVSDTNQNFEFRPRRTGDRVSIHMTHIANVITYAYQIPFYRVVNYEKTPIAYDWYDIDAKTNTGATDDQIRLMFQSLLEDRFHFQMHRETREMSEYVLTVAKGKSKMTPASSDDLMKFEIEGHPRTWPRGRCGVTSWRSGLRLICHAAPVSEMVSAITGNLGAPVADQTSLTGTYDVLLRFQDDSRPPDAEPEPPEVEPAPPLASALSAQLGLKLEKGKGPVEVLVIDRLTKPTEN